MGNQPSAPTQVPIPASITPPPLPPPCDLACQKQKKLVILKQELDSINPEQDPSGYDRARTAYFTTLKGPGWLAEEKNKIALKEVEPVLNSYKLQFDALQGEQQSQAVFTNLSNMLKSQEASDEQSGSFLKKQLSTEKDRAQVADRLNQLSSSNTTGISSSILSWVIDIVIALLGIFVLYKVYSRFASRNPMSLSQPVLSSV